MKSTPYLTDNTPSINNTVKFLKELDVVINCEIKPNRTPTRITVVITENHITPEIKDIIELYNSEIKNPYITKEGNLSIDLIIGEDYKPEGSNKIRERGGSKIISLTPEACNKSNFELNDKISFYARENEILLKK